MEYPARSKETRREGSKTRSPAAQQRAKGRKDNPKHGREERDTASGPAVAGRRNEVRRLKYALDPDYAARAKKTSRDSYRKDKPLGPSKLANGLLEEGQPCEVLAEGMDEPQTVTAFTIPAAAKALGRSELTLKRWIREGLVPPPVLRDTSRNYVHYSVGELTILARELAKHEKEMSYYALAHEVTQHAIWQAIQAYRSCSI